MATRFMAAVCAGTLLVPTAQAQYPQRHEGFWIGFGLGYGSATVGCDNCPRGPRTDGVTAFLKLGGTPRHNVLVGGALNRWSRSSDGVNERMRNITASLYYYPSAASGLFLTGGLGVSSYHVDAGPGVNGTGWGFSSGIGYDLRVGPGVSLTPVTNFLFGGVGDLASSGGGRRLARGWKQSVIDLGLGVTFH